MDITIAKSQLNLVKALQLCFNVYFIDKETLAALHGGGMFGHEINICIQREILNDSK